MISISSLFRHSQKIDMTWTLSDIITFEKPMLSKLTDKEVLELNEFLKVQKRKLMSLSVSVRRTATNANYVSKLVSDLRKVTEIKGWVDQHINKEI